MLGPFYEPEGGGGDKDQYGESLTLGSLYCGYQVKKYISKDMTETTQCSRANKGFRRQRLSKAEYKGSSQKPQDLINNHNP
jgi:hypothetical protein